MKNVFYKIWNYSPAQMLNIIRNKISLPKYVPAFEIEPKELERLQKMPRYLEGETTLMGKKINFIDAYSYLAMCDEIFTEENYKFISKRENPLIIDCGSNIGLSIIFFKLLYPKSRIIAFEPDKNAFWALKKNVESFGFKGVGLNNKAVWTADEKVNFCVEGSWGGKINNDTNGGTVISVDGIRLNKILNERVDFLKIDIEGAEKDIINDCATSLVNVENVFIEYHSTINKKQSLPEILSVISAAGMRYYIGEASHRKYPFLEKIISGFDLQLNISACREK